ncbi:hypothetical protein TIFTF001_042579 [Ficus carica]|uniref:Uncharacterized protein n=1 Tax=Ficus carica TaxID=3494 RepID=A0AA87ZP93_FICCA|nr:hypothetical protein TIFTF001_042579 [Ficus carica]
MSISKGHSSGWGEGGDAPCREARGQVAALLTAWEVVHGRVVTGFTWGCSPWGLHGCSLRWGKGGVEFRAAGGQQDLVVDCS